MTMDLSILMAAICLGAMLQVGIGIGFSILAGPPLMILMGTGTAVPVLLLLNTIVSAVATDRHILRGERRTIATALTGCLIGIGLGLLVYPFLSEKFVLALTGGLLLIGVVTTLIPLRSAIGPVGFSAVSGLSGLATVWAATPGPLMVFGLIAKGRSAGDISKLVQPIALVAYGIAFVLHAMSNWQSIPFGPQLWAFVGATLAGSFAGRATRGYLPHSVIKAAIRVISLVACYVLFQRAYMIG